MQYTNNKIRVPLKINVFNNNHREKHRRKQNARMGSTQWYKLRMCLLIIFN